MVISIFFNRIPDCIADIRANPEAFLAILQQEGSSGVLKALKKKPNDLEGMLAMVVPASRKERRYGQFTVYDFRLGPHIEFWRDYNEQERKWFLTTKEQYRLGENEVLCAFQCVAPLSGGGEANIYLVNPDKSVVFKRTLASFQS